MKKHLFLCLSLCLAVVAAGWGQSTSAVTATPPSSSRLAKAPDAVDVSKLTRFNLNFPGGSPHDFAKAIEKAMGKPLNIIIPDEFESEKIPALKMNQVTLPDLFRGMEQASMVTIPYRTGSFYNGNNKPNYSYQQMRTSFTFQTTGPMTDESVWYFRGREKAPDPSIWGEPPAAGAGKTCRFYSLAPFLEGGYKVEDITTAVQTGWKMLDEKDTPKLSFHKETKLLIVVGEPERLATVDDVLKALQSGEEAAMRRARNAQVRPAAASPAPANVSTNAPAH